MKNPTRQKTIQDKKISSREIIWMVFFFLWDHLCLVQYYFAPSSRLRFSSKAEVSRYLKTHEISDPTPEQMKTEEISDPEPEQKKTEEISNPEPEQKQTQEISDPELEQKKTQQISDLEPKQKQTQDISEFEPAQKQTQDISDPEQEQKIRGSPKQSGKRKNVCWVLTQSALDDLVYFFLIYYLSDFINLEMKSLIIQAI